MAGPRICFLTAAYPNSQYLSNGIFIKDQAVALCEQGCRVIIIAPKIFDGDKLFENEAALKIYRFPFLSENKLLGEYHRIPTIRLLSYFISGFLKTLQVIKKEGCDVIHAHWVIPTGLIGVVVGKYLLGKPVLITAHGSDIRIALSKGRMVQALTRFTLARASRIVSVSHVLKKEIVGELGIDEQKVEIIPMGVDRSLFKPEDQFEARTKIGLPSNKRIVLFVGGISELKGLRYLVDAISEIIRNFSDTLLVLLGRGPLEAELRKKIALLSIKQNVKFVGEIAHREIPWWLNAADILVLPSLNEGFGLAALEATACGRPVIATDVGELSKIVKLNPRSMLVKPGDSKALAEKIRQFLEIPSSRLRKTDVKIPQEYDQKASIERLVNVYQSLREEKGGR